MSAPHRLLSLTLVLAGTALLAPAAMAQSTGNVSVVAQDGSGDATTLSAAIAAAAPGDVILVREGNYLPLSTFDQDSLIQISKPLTIIAEGTGAHFGILRVQDLGPGDEVVLRNLGFFSVPLFPLSLPSVQVLQCQGTVVFEDCRATGLYGPTFDQPGLPAMAITDSSGVSITRTTLTGGAGLSTQQPLNFGNTAGGPAVVVTRSKASFQHSTLTGGAGGTDLFFDNGGQAGGDGLVVMQSNVSVAGSSVTGGDGSDGSLPREADDAAGGDALVVAHAASLVRLLDATLAGGQGGALQGGGQAPAGSAQVVDAGIVQSLPFTARGTSVSPVVREGESVLLTLSGPPGELAKVHIGFDVAYAQLTGAKGVWLLGGALVGPIVLATLPPSGSVDVLLPVGPGALLGFDGLRVDVQGFTFGSEGFLLGNLSSALVLDPAL